MVGMYSSTNAVCFWHVLTTFLRMAACLFWVFYDKSTPPPSLPHELWDCARRVEQFHPLWAVSCFWSFIRCSVYSERERWRFACHMHRNGLINFVVFARIERRTTAAHYEIRPVSLSGISASHRVFQCNCQSNSTHTRFEMHEIYSARNSALICVSMIANYHIIIMMMHIMHAMRSAHSFLQSMRCEWCCWFAVGSNQYVVLLARTVIDSATT